MEDKDIVTYEIHMNEHGEILLPEEILGGLKDTVVVTRGPID